MKTTEITPINPFIIGKYVGSRYFCDRQEETQNLLKQLQNGRNVALISPRRMGKTGLIEHFFRQDVILQSYTPLFIDIYATNSLAEMVYLMGKSVYDTLVPKKTKWINRFFQIVSSLRVGLKIDSLSGSPTLDIGLGQIQAPETTLNEIFAFLETSQKPCVVAIDEFQQIGTYPEKNVEALLRTLIQRCKQTHFLFLGSRQHLMAQLFQSRSKPFYQSVLCMGLEAIPLDTYTAFAQQMFADYKKTVDKQVVQWVYQQFDGVTWFMQMMMNELFAMTAPKACATLDAIPAALYNVVMTQEAAYKALLARLTPKQKILLQAIAKESGPQPYPSATRAIAAVETSSEVASTASAATTASTTGTASATSTTSTTGTASSTAATAIQITSSAFIQKYHLMGSSQVQAALKPLLKYDLVVHQDKGYLLSDYFLAHWLRHYY